MIKKIHHIAIITGNYENSKDFYINKLGLEIIREEYRETRKSYKLDLALNGEYIIELFSFENPPERVSNPEAKGLRHLCFEVDNLGKERERLNLLGLNCEEIRVDEYTDKKFFFCKDPDNLPIEFYEE